MAREPLPAPQAGNGRPCPICGRPEDVVLTPFCSKRCADVDLHRWLKGTYVVPGDEPAGDDLEGNERTRHEPNNDGGSEDDERGTLR